MYNRARLYAIYSKTSGYCFYCTKRLTFKNHGRLGRRGAWEVDHGKPESKGGTDHLNNLHAACIECNRRKGDMTVAEFRKQMK